MTRSQIPATAMQGAGRLSYILLIVFLVILWIAGGASRPDALGQVVTRAAAWSVLIGIILFLPRPRWRSVVPVAAFLAAAVILVALQLVPLPPAIWQSLPGRELLVESAKFGGETTPWLPISISPAATANALGSLIVPAVTLVLVSLMPPESSRPVAGWLLLLILASCVLGLFQFSGASFDHPLVNDVRGEVSSSFANRNHLALFVAIGCLLAPVYAASLERRARWALPLALGFVLLCMLAILAIGSRAGLVLAAIAVPLGLLMVRKQIAERLRHLSKKWVGIVLSLVGLLLAGLIAAAAISGRAVSFDRLFAEGTDAGLRGMIRPTLYEMIGRYFPFGSGFGTFDAAYRIDEPTALLGPRYVNLAHNDILQVPLDGGLIGALLLVFAIAWWAWASVKAWWTDRSVWARAGSGVLLLIIVASAMDYPARTPMIMALIIIGATWLHSGTSPAEAAASSGFTGHNRSPMDTK